MKAKVLFTCKDPNISFTVRDRKSTRNWKRYQGFVINSNIKSVGDISETKL